MTDQEKSLYKDMKEGNWDAIEETRASAFEDGTSEEFDTDYFNAYAQYQSDHEMSEEDRVQNTAEKVQEENKNAPEVIEEEE